MEILSTKIASSYKKIWRNSIKSRQIAYFNGAINYNLDKIGFIWRDLIELRQIIGEKWYDKFLINFLILF